jgi:ankyrin repeat protein
LTEFRGIDVNMRNKFAVSPLMATIISNKSALIEQLLAAGARADVVDSIGRTCLHWAIEVNLRDPNSSTELISTLLKNTSNIAQ